MPTDASGMQITANGPLRGGKSLLRRAAPLIIAGLFVLVMQDRLSGIDRAEVMQGLRAVSAGQWAQAILATALSFWAVARYDGLLHGLLGTGVPARAARLSGASAIAVSQTLGFGIVSGTLVRWRMLPGLGSAGAARLSALVAASFLAGWAVFTALVLVVRPAPVAWLGPFQWGVLAAAAGAVMLSLCAPRLVLFGRALRLPSLRAMGTLLALTALDCLAAGAALYAVLPPGTAPGFALFLPAFLIALGAGLLSGTPGGVGPFEVTLLALLPQVDNAALLGGVLVWRAVYYALPACLGTAACARGRVAEGARDKPGLPLTPESLTTGQRGTLFNAPRAEAQLAYQGDKRLLADGRDRPEWVIARTGQTVVALGEPLLGDHGPALDRLITHARAAYRAPCLYKCSARMAAVARRRGFAALPIAREAHLVPASFAVQAPGFRQLRRKLRKAEQAGLRIEAPRHLPIARMRAVNAAWCAENGGARGFSMGMFCPRHLGRQRVFLAWIGDDLIGFASFHVGAREQTLDLMRQRGDAPDGTMHALIVAAIAQAAAEGCPRLSLAAVPFDGPLASAALARLRHRLAPAGLRQFKSAFAPEWETLYIAAPSRLALAVAGAEIAREILRPPAEPGQYAPASR